MFKNLSKGLLAAVFAAGVVPTVVAGEQQESKSGPIARQLTQALEAAKLDSIGAVDPSTGGFVAALYIPGTQLLVVSGKFETPTYGTHRLSKKEFRELYMDLMGASVAGSRVFGTDVSCDGLAYRPDGDSPADTWEQASKTHVFEGAKKAKLSDEDYLKVYSEADAQYARILALLLAQAKVGS
jgi:hypothetical protein